MDALGINLPGLITQIVSFAILFGILYMLLYKPILGMLEQRTNRIPLASPEVDRLGIIEQNPFLLLLDEIRLLPDVEHERGTSGAASEEASRSRFRFGVLGYLGRPERVALTSRKERSQACAPARRWWPADSQRKGSYRAVGPSPVPLCAAPCRSLRGWRRK